MRFLKVSLIIDKSKMRPNDAAILNTKYLIPESQILFMRMNGSSFTVYVTNECLRSMPPNVTEIAYYSTNDSVITI
jgi:hypothetical protein